MKSIEILVQMIEGCEIIIYEPDTDKNTIALARFVIKDCKQVIRQIQLETGRFHQIRAQLAKQGSPIMGDLKYGAREPLPDRSIALHAYQLVTPHAVKTNPSLNIKAPYPKKQWWQLFADLLKKDDFKKPATKKDSTKKEFSKKPFEKKPLTKKPGPKKRF